MGRHSKVSKHARRPHVRAVNYGAHASGHARKRRRPSGVSVLSGFAISAVLVLISGTIFAERAPQIFIAADATRTRTHTVVPPLVIESAPTYPSGTVLDKDGNPVSTSKKMAPTSSAAGTTSAPSFPSPTAASASTTVARSTAATSESDTAPSTAQAPQATISSSAPVTDAPPTEDFDGVRVHVARVGIFIKAQFHLVDVFGVGKRPNNPRSDHPKGLALDFMVYDDKRKGDAIRDCLQAHKRDWNITYVLWQVPDHFDHVHVSFKPNGVVRDLTCG